MKYNKFDKTSTIKKENYMKLQYKIALFMAAILIIVIGIIGGLSYKQMEHMLKEQLGKNTMDLAVVVAELGAVSDNIGLPRGDVKIHQEVETIRLKTHVQFIVVMDMNGIMYSHPLPENIGQMFPSDDDTRVLTTGESYISEGMDILGPSIRAFVPIYRGGEQVGAVCVGLLTGWVHQELLTIIQKFIPPLIIGLLLGIAAAFLLSYSIKRTIFGLEPEEIAVLLSEREAIFQSVSEGIAALDLDGKIIFFNQAAKDMLQLKEQGKCIALFDGKDVIEEILESGATLYNREIKTRLGITLLCNYSPLKQGEHKITGVVINFRDMTKVKHLAEELTGIKKLTWALRAQNHEFMNKLHTISGLIQLGEYDNAVQYISDTAKTRQDIMGILTNRIKNPTVAGLLLAKFNKVSESRIVMELDPDSILNSVPEGVTSEEISSVLGNLIENATDALLGMKVANIKVKIYECSETLNIEVSNNGPDIPDSIQDKIYERGVSTKEGPHGFGLLIVKKIIDEARGSIHFTSENGTTWYVSIPLKRRPNNDICNDN
jgi:two-component system, CitB family, sensor kinase